MHVCALSGAYDVLLSAVNNNTWLLLPFDAVHCVGSLLLVTSKWKFKYRFLPPLQEAQAALQKKKN